MKVPAVAFVSTSAWRVKMSSNGHDANVLQVKQGYNQGNKDITYSRQVSMHFCGSIPPHAEAEETFIIHCYYVAADDEYIYIARREFQNNNKQ
jgi:hypothetical protein